jgi:phage-related minor tail protein
MKKTILVAILLGFAVVSCQQKTKEKVGETTNAISEEVEQKVDTITANAENIVDSTQLKTGEALEKGAKKMDEAGKKLKKASKE